MTSFILFKLFRALVTLVVAASLVFMFIRFSGDPAAALAPPDAPQEVIDQYARAMGLDKPLWQQYAAYFGGLLTGDFGYSIHTGRAASDLFLERLPYTLKLGGAALLIAIATGIPLGAIAALNRKSLIDRGVMAFSVFAFAMPNFPVRFACDSDWRACIQNLSRRRGRSRKPARRSAARFHFRLGCDGLVCTVRTIIAA